MHLQERYDIFLFIRPIEAFDIPTQNTIYWGAPMRWTWISISASDISSIWYELVWFRMAGDAEWPLLLAIVLFDAEVKPSVEGFSLDV